MFQLTIGRLALGGVITNYNCSPHRPKDYLDESLAGIIFRRTAALGCGSVHIGGGEPLLPPDKLAACHQKHYGKRQRRIPAWTKTSR